MASQTVSNEQITTFLKTNPKATTASLAAAFGVHRDTMRQRLNALAEEGTVFALDLEGRTKGWTVQSPETEAPVEAEDAGEGDGEDATPEDTKVRLRVVLDFGDQQFPVASKRGEFEMKPRTAEATAKRMKMHELPAVIVDLDGNPAS